MTEYSNLFIITQTVAFSFHDTVVEIILVRITIMMMTTMMMMKITKMTTTIDDDDDDDEVMIKIMLININILFLKS